MPTDAVAYLLLALDVVVVALVLAAPVCAVLWLVGHRASRRRRAAVAGHAPAESVLRVDDRVLRRCAACDLLWKGRPGHHLGRVSLRLRRWVRRRRRTSARPVPPWAQRQGWSRCPRCLSSSVRLSRAGASGR